MLKDFAIDEAIFGICLDWKKKSDEEILVRKR
jgi:hypothetical protein